MSTPVWILEGLSALSVAAPIAAVAGGIAWFVSKQTVDYKSKQWLQDHKGELDRQLEDHKAVLEGEADRRRLAHRRQELILEYEFLAAQAVAHFADVALDKFAGPDADDPDIFRDEVAANFVDSAKKISFLLRSHEIALSPETVSLLKDARHHAKVGDYSYAQDNNGERKFEYSISSTTADHVDKFCKALSDAREQVRRDIMTGTLTKLD